ncbi:unnamed protein product [Pleuronectes platessa]|uniref:Uncharacterized protein n=1 Tax=Pleuronectes platessa TaxID=8262 RepID=A0A9N7TQA4_PLEPL|nr:unnamed protein product [Pleuronectes platessa]
MSTLATPSFHILTGGSDGIPGYHWLMYKERRRCTRRLQRAASQRGLRQRPAMFTRLSNTHTVCPPPETASLGLGPSSSTH